MSNSEFEVVCCRIDVSKWDVVFFESILSCKT